MSVSGDYLAAQFRKDERRAARGSRVGRSIECLGNWRRERTHPPASALRTVDRWSTANHRCTRIQLVDGRRFRALRRMLHQKFDDQGQIEFRMSAVEIDLATAQQHQDCIHLLDCDADSLGAAVGRTSTSEPLRTN